MSVIAVDFDGTCVAHEFPKIGRDIGAVPVLQDLVKAGHQLIIFTMRSNGQQHGDVLNDAIKWFAENNIPLYGVQKNPTQMSWTTSPKCHANLIIDDTSLGIPLVDNGKERPYVDWEETRKLLVQRFFLPS
jgi:hypothetical protein